MYITVIGSSPGESVIVQFANGDVITIDCCETGGINFTMDNIDRLGLNYDNIIYNIITHFHDDHIKGVSDLVAKCQKSKIVIPDAWTKDVFKQFVATVSDEVSLTGTSVTREIEKLFDVLGDAPQRLFAVSELTSLFPAPAGGSADGESLIVLTPRSTRKARFLSDLAAAIVAGDVAAMGFCLNNKNATSISCLARYHDGYIFLGGDVENLAPEFDIKNTHLAHLAQVGRYDLVKMPHHGSSTSFCDELRSRIDDEKTVVAITPYPKGKKPLPSLDAQNHLKGAQRIWVLAGERIALPRKQRSRSKLFNLAPNITYRPGILEFMEGEVETTRCVSLEDFLSGSPS